MWAQLVLWSANYLMFQNWHLWGSRGLCTHIPTEGEISLTMYDFFLSSVDRENIIITWLN